MENTKPNAQLGALTLVLLVKLFRSQMIALLLKNGVAVSNGASDQQISMLMADLLKVSKSFFTDLNDFIQNPKVLEVIMSSATENAPYFKMSGNEYMNYTLPYRGYESSYNPNIEDEDEDPVLASTIPATTPPKKGLFSGFNIPDFLSDSMKLFGDYTKSKSDAEIARQRAIVAKADAGVLGGVPTKDDDKEPDEKISTTVVVVLSLVGVAVLGTVIYFVLKAKK